jgi:diaminopropionate ammonia-lyase family
MSQENGFYFNPTAQSWALDHTSDFSFVQKFHQSLPGFAPSPLVSLAELAKELGVREIFVKDESSRIGLPSFKILGASWGAFRAIASRANLPLDASLSQISAAARKDGIKLFAATDGNHGRAVARIASLFDLKAEIFVPNFMKTATRKLIVSEGAEVSSVDGDYDAAVNEASRHADATPAGLLVQDTSFEGYEVTPTWIVEGYSTMLTEIEQELDKQNFKATLIVTPVGVGSLAQAVVSFCKSNRRAITVLATEPDTAACLHESLKAGASETLRTTGPTICDGMNCGTVSPIAWPVLRSGVDASVTVPDAETHAAVQYLKSHGVNAGPCGAATIAGLRRVAALAPDAARLDSGAIVVLLSTEGTRYYEIPN